MIGRRIFATSALLLAVAALAGQSMAAVSSYKVVILVSSYKVVILWSWNPRVTHIVGVSGSEFQRGTRLFLVCKGPRCPASKQALPASVEKSPAQAPQGSELPRG